MAFRIAFTSLWIVSCVAGQHWPIEGHALMTPWSGASLPFTSIISLPIPETKMQYHYEDGFGSGKYGHDEPTSSHHATHDIFGNKAGEFSYVKPDGTIHKTSYIADSLGYRVLSNDLPVGPADVPAHSLKKRSVGYPYAGVPTVTPSGYLADTPEVAAAKASHFQEHAKRGNFHVAAPYSAWPGQFSAPAYREWSGTVGNDAPSWHHQAAWPTAYPSIPSAYPTVTADGYLKDTPEVASAKAAHFAEKAKVEMKIHADQFNYYPVPAPQHAVFPYAVPSARAAYPPAPLSADGQVTDTPEVSAAKASHFREYAAALARSDDSGSTHQIAAPLPSPHMYSFPTAYSGASGLPAETPEVAQARATHFAEYAQVASRGSTHQIAAPLPSPHMYSFPTAYSGASGLPAETPEVAQAKAAHFAEYAQVASRSKRSISDGNFPASTGPLIEAPAPAVHHFAPSYPISPIPYGLPYAHLAKSSIIHSPSVSPYHIFASVMTSSLPFL